jgi:hypothetical protein
MHVKYLTETKCANNFIVCYVTQNVRANHMAVLFILHSFFIDECHYK